MNKGYDSRKITYLFGLLSLLFLAWSFMHPMHEFPGGIDTFNYLKVTNTTLHYGRLLYVSHPLSIWGVYPYSYVTGPIILLGSCISLTGLNGLYLFLFYNYVLATLATTSVFALLLKINRDIRFVMTGTFIFIFSPRIIRFFFFTFGAREIFLFLTPVFMLACVMYMKNKREKKLLWLAVIILFILSLVHLNFLFLAPFIYAIGVTKLIKDMKFNKNIRKIKKTTINNIANSSYFKIFFWVAIVAILFISLFAVAEFAPTHKVNLELIQERGFFEGEDNLTILLNIGVSVLGGSSFGVLMFGIIGFLSVFAIKRKDEIENIFIIAAVASIPLTIVSIYSRPFIVIYTSIFAAYGFLWITKQKISYHKIIVFLLVVILISGSFIFIGSREPKGYGQRAVGEHSPYLEGRRIDYYISYETYNAGIYLKYHMSISERYASYKRPYDQTRIEAISTRARYGIWYSIGEMEEFYEGDSWYVIRRSDSDITNPYIALPPQYVLYPEFFTGNRNNMEALATERNITIVYSHPNEPIRDMNIFILNNNRYKIYENEENIFWRF